MISPYKIKWLNQNSLEYDTWTGLSFDGDSGDVDAHLSREAVVSEAYNGTLKRAHGYKWDNDYVVTLTFIKQDYSDFTPTENRKILSWLTGSKNASFLDVYMDDSEAIAYSLLGNWTSISQYKLGNGRIVGYVAEFESLTPWAFSPLRTITQDMSDPSNNSISLLIKTDELEGVVYPRIIIEQDKITSVVEVDHAMSDIDRWVDGTVYHYNDTYYWVDSEGVKHESSANDSGFETTSVVISNTYTDEDGNTQIVSSTVKNNIKGETIVLDGANKVISSSHIDGRIFGSDFDWYWIPLMPGRNIISVIGNCSITMEWRTIIKTGDF